MQEHPQLQLKAMDTAGSQHFCKERLKLFH